MKMTNNPTPAPDRLIPRLTTVTKAIKYFRDVWAFLLEDASESVIQYLYIGEILDFPRNDDFRIMTKLLLQTNFYSLSTQPPLATGTKCSMKGTRTSP